MVTEDKINAVLAENCDKIFFYALRHTENELDAEDLARDIILAILASYRNLRNDKALYGFIWKVAQNQCRVWARKKSRQSDIISLDENNIDISDELVAEDNSDIQRIRTELSLCSSTYRKLLIGFYKYRKSCDELAKEFNKSEGDVKFLLFKARKKIKEGMQMERILGERSYEPQSIAVLYFGSGNNIYYNICKKKIVQNILMACYNDVCTLQDISLQIGCAVPYIEDEIMPLLECGLLCKVSRDKYSTNIIMLTSVFKSDFENLTGDMYSRIGDLIASYVKEHKEQIRSIGFLGSDMDDNSFLWHIALIALKITSDELVKEDIKDKDIVFGVENYNPEFEIAWCRMISLDNSILQFMDVFSEDSHYPKHKWLYGNYAGVNLLFDIARSGKEIFEGTEGLVFENISSFVIKRGGVFVPSMPVYTEFQWEKLIDTISSLVDEIKTSFADIFDKCVWLLQNHAPKTLKDNIHAVASMYIGSDIFKNVIKYMFSQKLLCFSDSEFMPTAYMILK